MKALKFLSLFFIFFSCLPGQSIEVRDGWFYVNGSKFFVKGIGYETHARPGQLPWVYEFEPDIINLDLQRIKEAGFNTIRTWGVLSEEQMDLVQASGLKIIFGIWIDPAGDFADTGFLNQSLTMVDNVLLYSHNYSAIIAYLIMNEPMPEHINTIGSDVTLSFWNTIITRIKEKHPGVPVSVALAGNTDFCRSDHFTFNAYNLYVYNPYTVRDASGYARFVSYLQKNRTPQNPLIITEFGLSVSATTTDQPFGYGGNSLEQQATGDLKMYRDAIDGGASGACVFQYHDGWFKAGNEFVHDNLPEEWFGLFSFDSGNNNGDARPAWDSLDVYNRAIICNPKNGEIYASEIPFELFLDNTIKRVDVLANQVCLQTFYPQSAYFSDFINYPADSALRDVLFTFRFFNGDGTLIKSENITTLISEKQIELPNISFQFYPGEIIPGTNQSIVISLNEVPPFTIENNEMSLAFFPHIGWDPGESVKIPVVFNDGLFSSAQSFSIPANTLVTTFSAGATITHGKYKRRISSEKILISGDWADDIASPEIFTGIDEVDRQFPRSAELFPNYPNPFNPSTKISYSLSVPGFVRLRVFNIKGQYITTLIDDFQSAGLHKITFPAGNLPSGTYFYLLQTGKFLQARKMSLIK